MGGGRGNNGQAVLHSAAQILTQLKSRLRYLRSCGEHLAFTLVSSIISDVKGLELHEAGLPEHIRLQITVPD